MLNSHKHGGEYVRGGRMSNRRHIGKKTGNVRSCMFFSLANSATLQQKQQQLDQMAMPLVNKDNNVTNINNNTVYTHDRNAVTVRRIQQQQQRRGPEHMLLLLQ